MKTYAVLLLIAISCPTMLKAETVTGTVYLDTDRDGVMDAGELGLSGVRVSDGSSVVLTDENGRYSLNIEDEAIVFITKPSGYATPLNHHNLPQFYYIHQPEGSPEGLRYPGIEPTGELPEAINFALVPRDEATAFEAILLADTQPQSQRELDYIRDDVITELIGSDAVFGMTMGDILYDNMSMFPRFNALIAEVGLPWYNVPGNHEINFNAKGDKYSLETFKRYFGPPYYAFEYGDAVFVVLDNIYYKGNGQADPGDIRGNGGYDNTFTKEQLNWLARELKHVPKDKLVMLAMHAPLGNEAGTVESGNRRTLFKLLKDRPNLYSVAGHTHTTEHMYFDKDDGFTGPGQFHHHVLTTVSGSWWSGPFDERGIPTTDQRDGTPNGYHILEVDGAALSVRFKAAGEAANYQMRIMLDVEHHGQSKEVYPHFREGTLLDGAMNSDEVPAAAILVNLFDGGPKSVVEYSIGSGPYKAMTRTLRKDPYIMESFERHKDERKQWVQARPSTHLFSADLDDNLGPGVYTINVRAKDEFGQLHHGHKILEILAGFEGSEAGLRYPE